MLIKIKIRMVLICCANQNLGYFIIVVVENIKTKINKFYIYVFKVAI
jgi:hypothetical protein